MATLRTLTDIVVLLSLESGAGFGYSLIDPLQADGSFAYTYESQRREQIFKRGNLALRDSGPDGRPIRILKESRHESLARNRFPRPDAGVLRCRSGSSRL